MEARKLLDALLVAERLKDTTRHCYTSKGRHESVAEHSWMMTLMAFFLRDEFPEADMDKVIRMCIIHDLGECFTGDIPTFEKNQAHEQTEENLLYSWLHSLPEKYAAEMRELYEEMAERKTVEAQIYKAIDGLEALIQHNASDLSTWIPKEFELNLTYADDKVAFSDYFKSLRQVVREDTIKKIDEAKKNSAANISPAYGGKMACSKIRNEEEPDYERVEEITRKAFWNLYIPGCNEHYLVHVMRSHKDFLPELDFVIEVDNQIIGNIMYTKTKLIDESGEEKDILTFGPVCILPEYQRKGYGKKLMEHSFEKAVALGYDVIVIFGNPGNYVSRGFKSCKKYNVCLENGTYPAAMMVKELKPDALEGRKWIYYQSPVFEIEEQEAEHFNEGLETLEKKYQPSQDEFYIHSHAIIHP